MDFNSIRLQLILNILTFMTRHKENGTVIKIRNTERAVRRNAVNPSPSESAVKIISFSDRIMLLVSKH